MSDVHDSKLSPTTAATGPTRSEILRASPPMFETRWLDRLSRVHHLVPVAIYVPAVIVFAVLGFSGLSPLRTVLSLIGGYLFWTFCEYWIHRVVFHFEPEDGFGARLHWIVHGVHHDHPNDPMRLVMPPAVSVPLAAVFVLAFVLVLGTPTAWGVTAGFLAGYLFYDELHYALHHYTPKSRMGKRLRELHMRHHFEDEERGFGISAPWWDVVFRTLPRRRTSARS